eukprot:NODE_11858_length_1261_cov_3.709877.p1 GENE.NODE_11858_length_1261_cov_3.709877~~NODE_11858_length_1261_cov_3.709877.p1  ORF type:complete len:229 (-),score=45.90 NODE_11858_length_1261_cov_3.709877:414-1100(-)
MVASRSSRSPQPRCLPAPRPSYEALAEFLKHSRKLGIFRLEARKDVCLTPSCMNKLGKVLTVMAPYIRFLALDFTKAGPGDRRGQSLPLRLTDLDYDPMFVAVKKTAFKELRVIDWSFNETKLQDAGASKLCDALMACPQLLKIFMLDLAGTGISDNAIDVLATRLKRHPGLRQAETIINLNLSGDCDRQVRCEAILRDLPAYDLQRICVGNTDVDTVVCHWVPTLHK